MDVAGEISAGVAKDSWRAYSTPGLSAAFLSVIAVFAVLAFPFYDDAYLVLYVRESGAGSLLLAHPHRPAFGLLLQGCAELFGLRRGCYVAAAVVSWAVLAYQTQRLARRLFPEDALATALVPLLVLAPIAVSTQYTTLTTVLPANLPITLCLAALLVGLRPGAGRSFASCAALAVLPAIAATISEYAVATTLAAVVVLASGKHYRSVIWILGGVVVGYVVFRLLGNVELRSQQVATAQVRPLLHHPVGSLFAIAAGVWRVIFGGFALTVGGLFVGPARETVLPACFGVGTAFVVYRSQRGAMPAALHEGAARSWGTLVVAVAAGVLPVVCANQSPASADPYESRYLLPVLPFAAIAFSVAGAAVSAPRFRRAIATMVAFVAGYAVVAVGISARAEQRRMEALGTALLPQVTSSAGITVAVVPSRARLDSSDITPKVTFTWDDASARRLWVMTAVHAEEQYGVRGGCSHISRIDTPRELLGGSRHGTVASVLWFPDAWGADPIRPPESYCVAPEQ